MDLLRLTQVFGMPKKADAAQQSPLFVFTVNSQVELDGDEFSATTHVWAPKMNIDWQKNAVATEYDYLRMDPQLFVSISTKSTQVWPKSFLALKSTQDR